MSDLDKDIETLKEHIKELEEEKVLYGGFLSRKEAIENVLKELETYKKIEDFMADFIVENIDRIDTKPWCRFLVYNSSSKWLSSGKKEKGL